MGAGRLRAAQAGVKRAWSLCLPRVDGRLTGQLSFNGSTRVVQFVAPELSAGPEAEVVQVVDVVTGGPEAALVGTGATDSCLVVAAVRGELLMQEALRVGPNADPGAARSGPAQPGCPPQGRWSGQEHRSPPTGRAGRLGPVPGPAPGEP